MQQANNNPNNNHKVPSLAEQWPYLRFLGLGTWWAWVWLCYNSVELMRLFPSADHNWHVLAMYLFSTAAIGLSMLIAAAAFKTVTRMIDSRLIVLAFGLFAALATGLLGFSAYSNNDFAFAILAACTGLGTSFLCLRVGRIYGSISLGDSLTSGAIALLLAAFLYFVGIGLPQTWRLPFIALLPLVSALLLSLKTPDDSLIPNLIQADGNETVTEQNVSLKPKERLLIVRLAVAVAIIAFITGVGKGLFSNNASNDYAYQGILSVAVVGLIAIAIVFAVNLWPIRFSARRIYSSLMMLMIVLLLASLFGLPLTYLSVAKEPLWLMLSCFMAYIAFRLNYSPVRIFGICQTTYFLSSATGWIVGSLLPHPEVADNLVMVIPAVFALLIVFAMVFDFSELHVARITELAMDLDLRADEQHTTHNLNTAKSAASARLDERGLSQREIEVMELFATGHSANWIADTLFVSNSTVRSHIRAIYVKLDVHSRQELIDFLDSD